MTMVFSQPFFNESCLYSNFGAKSCRFSEQFSLHEYKKIVLPPPDSLSSKNSEHNSNSNTFNTTKISTSNPQSSKQSLNPSTKCLHPETTAPRPPRPPRTGPHQIRIPRASTLGRAKLPSHGPDSDVPSAEPRT